MATCHCPLSAPVTGSPTPTFSLFQLETSVHQEMCLKQSTLSVVATNKAFQERTLPRQVAQTQMKHPRFSPVLTLLPQWKPCFPPDPLQEWAPPHPLWFPSIHSQHERHPPKEMCCCCESQPAGRLWPSSRVLSICISGLWLMNTEH